LRFSKCKMNSRIEELRGVAMNLSIRSKGFSLVEVLVALLILAISLLALAGLMVSTTRNNSLGGHITEAATFAQDKLEQLRAAPWVSILKGTDTVTTAIPNVLPGSGIIYTRTWTVAYSASVDQAWITVTINWTDPTAKTTHSISLPPAVVTQ
jgi:prepilin-type N-terminal cleavage/methylation domain-containing protein